MAASSSLRRRWRGLSLLGLVILLALAVAAGIGLRDNIFREMMDPGQPFQTYTPPPAPDYAQWSAWARAPSGADLAGSEAAVFFIHPTTYWGGDNWNAPTDHPEANARLDEIMLPNHAEPFAAAGPVFAPRYRQASLYTFLTSRDDARYAREFAYEDVARAFDAFLDYIGEDRAFIIAGIEQGGLHAVRLLQDVVAERPGLRERMAAAYIIGFPLPQDLFETSLSAFEPCTRPDDYRCIVAWSAARGEDLRTIRHLTSRQQIWTPGGEFRSVEGRPLLCINPLLWTSEEDFAPARLNKGAAAAEGLEPGVSPSPLPGATSAQCQDGLLLVERPDSGSLQRPLSLGGRYKAPPFNLFYADIRENVKTRLDAFLPVLSQDQKMAEPIRSNRGVDESPVNRVPD